MYGKSSRNQHEKKKKYSEEAEHCDDRGSVRAEGKGGTGFVAADFSSSLLTFTIISKLWLYEG